MFLAKCALFSQKGRGQLRVESVVSAKNLAGGGLSPESATTAVRRELLSAGTTGLKVVVGVDSPPSIAKEFISDKSWIKWSGCFADTYPTPEAFREATSLPNAKTRAGSRREPKRQTDIKHKTPLPPQNLRMYKQTWWAIHGIFAPLFLVCVQMAGLRSLLFCFGCRLSILIFSMKILCVSHYATCKEKYGSQWHVKCVFKKGRQESSQDVVSM